MIDLHAHVVLEGVLGRAGALGPELIDDPVCPTFRVGDYVLEGVRYRGSAFMDVDVRLTRMDELGVSFQVLSPNPITYLAGAPADVAIEFARWHNDEMAVLVGQHPDRLAGFAQLPMQSPAAAADELRRAVADLGLVAPYVGTDYGTALDDPSFDAVWRQCVALDVPVFFHPGPARLGVAQADSRLERFDLELVLGFAYEEALAIATLVFGGVLDRHPELRVCVSHGGGALIAIIGKMRRAVATRPWASVTPELASSFEATLRRFWFDAHMSDERALASLSDLVGADRIVGGTNFAGWDQPTSKASITSILDQADQGPALDSLFGRSTARRA